MSLQIHSQGPPIDAAILNTEGILGTRLMWCMLTIKIMMGNTKERVQTTLPVGNFLLPGELH